MQKKFIAKLMAVTIAVSMMSLLAGCSDEDFEDYSDRIDFTSEADFPNGACDYLDGTVVVMSIAANDQTTNWDFNNQADVETLSSISQKFFTGLKWIEDQGKAYGKNIKFIYNWDDDNELFYTANLSEDYSKGQANLFDQKTFIDENLSAYASKLVKKYNADNILFAIYFNEPQDTNFICFATPFKGTERGMDYPYETVCIDKYVNDCEQGPATYAHEVLHVFGAPDLYCADEDGSNWGITQEFVDYCTEEHINDIMYSCYDPFNNYIPLEEVTNELSDITAYYLGWTDSCEECETYGLK